MILVTHKFDASENLRAFQNVGGRQYSRDHAEGVVLGLTPGTAARRGQQDQECSMRELIYLSTRKLAMFYPGRISRSVQFTGGLGLGPVSAKIDKSAPPSGADEATTTLLNRAVRYLEREAVHFSHSELSPGRWIFFDLNMGYGTSYRDSGSPPKIDDIALFHGSFNQVETDKQSPIDLLLCGSTEHLRIRTASAGRMGSGTEWLYDLTREIEEIDASTLENFLIH